MVIPLSSLSMHVTLSLCASFVSRNEEWLMSCTVVHNTVHSSQDSQMSLFILVVTKCQATRTQTQVLINTLHEKQVIFLVKNF